MSNAPTISRPSVPEVLPVVYEGVRYEEDRVDAAQGDQNGGYLAALDDKSGKRLWRLKLYDVPDHRAAGVTSGGIYFRFLRRVPGKKELEIANEVGGVYRVDLRTRNITKLSGPSDVATPVPAKPKPKPN